MRTPNLDPHDPPLLFDLQTDPGANFNVAAQPPDVLAAAAGEVKSNQLSAYGAGEAVEISGAVLDSGAPAAAQGEERTAAEQQRGAGGLGRGGG